MARLAAAAQRQVASLGLYYSVNNRVEALERLRRAVSEALERIDDPDTVGRSYPANYRAAASRGTLWLKVHIYWFGYCKAVDGTMAISNVIWQGADIPSRIQSFDETP